MMRGAVLYGPRDVRFEERATPTIVEPTDAVIRLSATCICGSDLWPYRGISAINAPTPMGHEYCGIIEDVGRAVRSITPGQFVIGIVLRVRQYLAALPGRVSLVLPRRAIKTLLRP